VVGQKNDTKTAAGLVLEQDPAPRTQIKEARTLRVVLSLGPRRMSVPDVRGLALRAARIRLDQTGVPVRRILETPSGAPEETVLHQTPEPGPAETVGDGVLLVVAKNGSHRDYVMPDLIGKSVDDVARAFQARGFVPPQIHYRAYPGLGRGTILSQNPLAGYRLSPRTAVVFEVSQGGA
jgi:serine/threonine-protein kinase